MNRNRRWAREGNSHSILAKQTTWLTCITWAHTERSSTDLMGSFLVPMISNPAHLYISIWKHSLTQMSSLYRKQIRYAGKWITLDTRLNQCWASMSGYSPQLLLHNGPFLNPDPCLWICFGGKPKLRQSHKQTEFKFYLADLGNQWKILIREVT
jgi:hypothetical protein